MKPGIELTLEPGHLTEKAVAAAESRMSYGKWRSQFPPYSPPSAPAEPGEFKYIRHCKECDTVFGTDNPKKVFCCMACKDKNNKRRQYRAVGRP